MKLHNGPHHAQHLRLFCRERDPLNLFVLKLFYIFFVARRRFEVKNFTFTLRRCFSPEYQFGCSQCLLKSEAMVSDNILMLCLCSCLHNDAQHNVFFPFHSPAQ